MGVEFTCGLTEWHQSYSGLQESRRTWIMAAVEYLKGVKYVENPDSENDDETQRQWFESERSVVEKLKKALQPTTILIGLCYVNYNEFENVNKDSLRFFGLIGLHMFVKHSDCEGSYCPGEAMEMLSTFKKIEPFLTIDEDEREHYKNFVKVMEESVSTGKNVELH